MKSYVDIQVTLEGISGILFDRFVDYSTDKRPADQKLYLINDNQVILPAENILSGFLCGVDPKGCPKVFEGKKGADYIRMIMSHAVITPDAIPFLDGAMKPVKFTGFGNKSQFQIVTASARTKKGSLSIKQEAQDRPLLTMPWHLKFGVKLFNNTLVDENKLRNYFERGGIEIALGTWRPRYGRFMVKEWTVE